MKKTIFSLATLAATLAFTSCSDKEIAENIIPDNQKGLIQFSMSDAGGTMSSSSMTRAGFESNTQIVARIESFKSTTIGGTIPTTGKRSTRTVMTAQSHNSHSNIYSDVTTSDPRFWDDCFGRYANLSVYAVAVPGKTDITNGSTTSTTLANLVSYGGDNVSSTNTVWKVEGSSTSNNNIVWEVTKGARTKGTSISGQTATTIGNEDLTYSNNIQSNATLGKDGVYRWDYNATPTPGYPAFSYTPTETDQYPNFTDGVLRFTIPGSDETAPGHFDKGHLIFKHALTRLTINLKRGDGFATGADYFKFNKEGSTDETNVKIIGVPVKNTLNIETGAWSTTSGDITTGSIEKISPATQKSGFDHSLMAQFIPGYAFTQNNSTNVLEFTIDDNTYYVTQQMIWKALNDNKNNNGLADATSYTMEQGKNYILDITVKKTGIQNVTATLVDWGKVQAANIDANNSYISISSATMGAKTTQCDHFDLYRLDAGVTDIYTNQNGVTIPEKKNWGGNYTDKASTLEEKKDAENNGTGIWKTNWYWVSNKSFYHFRSVDNNVAINGATGDGADTTDDYFNVYSGPVNDTWNTTSKEISTAINDKKYNDYHWGAPMKTGASLTYNVTSGQNEGYSESLYQAIGSTTDQINMIEQHMMSTVHFVIHTGTKADGTPVTGGQVTLMDNSNNGTRLTLTNFSGEGQVKMGNGFITPNSTMISSDIPVPGATISYGTGTSANILSTLATSSSDYFTTASTVTKSYDYRVVPQALYHGTGTAATDETLSNFIGLTIVTPDDNQYYVIKKLYGVEGTITNNGNKNEHNATSGKAPIYRWYPGYDYTYHIYVNKTGIEKITCTVVDWVKVEGNVGDINLEN